MFGSRFHQQQAHRPPSASINFITAHDGFTLADLVAYNDKHNEANAEGNRDGESHNRSWNCGAEGPADDAEIDALRRRQRRNFLATLSGAYAVYGRAWLATSAAILISVVAHAAHYSTFWCANMAIEATGPRKPTAAEIYSALPVIETVAALPITPGGLGTREKLFDAMLTPLANLSEGVAPAISVLGYLCIVFWGIVGGFFYVFYRPSRKERQAMLAETKAQLGGTHLG